jgi:hypothetical protein
MMMMASGDDSPSGRSPEKGPDWFLVDTEAFGGGTSDLGIPHFFWNIWEFIGRRGGAGGLRGGHHPPGRAGAPGVCLWVVATSGRLSGSSSVLQWSSGPEKIVKKFRSIWRTLIFCTKTTPR